MVDLPGMIRLDRTYRYIEVDGLTIEIPSQDFASILYELKLKERRSFANGTWYYKLTTRFFCVVFTQVQRDALIAGMEAQLEAAEVEAEADNQAFCEALDVINQGPVKVISQRAEMIRESKKDTTGKN